ncbi:MAG: hypothetical protein ACJAU2_001394 [Maribacter sp.]|jgi:hypothetical protein
MKIRIKGNSIRLRLTKSEVAAFCDKGQYQEAVIFGNRTLTYSLVAKEGIEMLDATYVGDTIIVYITKDAKDTWLESDRVGYSNVLDSNSPDQLSILVEKDFICMDDSIEDQSDNYPNPKL